MDYAARSWRWARANLFNSTLNTALTIIAVYLLASVLPPLGEWAFMDAVWSGTADACRAAEGACWAFIQEKHGVILFGTFPADQYWRPILAIIVLLGVVGASLHRALWHWWLSLIWLGALIAIAVLMWGGVFGLEFVDAHRWGGLPLTLLLAVFGIGLSFPLGVLAALGRQSDLPGIRAVCIGLIEIIRGVPLISVLFMAMFLIPLFLPQGVNFSNIFRVLIGIVLFSGAYTAEVVRGGLQSVPKGQIEAAASVGLSYWQTMRLVVLPQALRVVIPPMVGNFIALLKDTSLVVIVGMFDLLGTMKNAALKDPEWAAFYKEGYLFIAIIFFIFCYSMARYSIWLEKDLSKGGAR